MFNNSATDYENIFSDSNSLIPSENTDTNSLFSTQPIEKENKGFFDWLVGNFIEKDYCNCLLKDDCGEFCLNCQKEIEK
jgi:hypothetical protein